MLLPDVPLVFALLETYQGRHHEKGRQRRQLLDSSCFCPFLAVMYTLCRISWGKGTDHRHQESNFVLPPFLEYLSTWKVSESSKAVLPTSCLEVDGIYCKNSNPSCLRYIDLLEKTSRKPPALIVDDGQLFLACFRVKLIIEMFHSFCEGQ